MGNGNAKFATNGNGDGKTYPGWDRPMQTNGGAQHQPSRRYSTTSEESIDDAPVAASSPPPLSSRRASPSRASVLAPLSRESTALSLGQRIALHAARQEPSAQSPPAHGPQSSARILPPEPDAFESNSSQKRLQAERKLFPRAPHTPETDGGFLAVESSREAPLTDSEAKWNNNYWVPDRGSEKLSYSQEIGNFRSEEKPRGRRGVSFALHDEILQERSSTFVLPLLNRTDSHQSVGNGAPPPQDSSRLPIIGISRRENRPRSSSAKKIQVGTAAGDAAISNQQRLLPPQARLPRNSTLQKTTALPPPSATNRSGNSQWPTDDDSTSGIGSSTGSITSHTTRYPRSFVRPKHSTSLPSLNSNDTATVPWSDSELLLPRPSLRILPPANATSVEANFYHIYHHGIPKKRKKWVLRP